MTQPPPEQRPETPATEDKGGRASGKGNFVPVIITCAAAIVLLAVAVAVLISTLGGGGAGSAARSGSDGARPGEGSAAGSKPSSTTTSLRVMPGKVLELEDHPLLRDDGVGLSNKRCDLPEWENTKAEAKAFFRAATQCLDEAWAPLLRSYNLPFTPPRLYFPSGSSFDSDCGTIDVGLETAAYYCEGELFLPWGGLQIEQYENNPGVFLALIAHEYGHHVQELAGIMDAAWRKIYGAGEGSEEGREMSRRKELQAQCFSGMFLGAHVDRGGSITRQMYDAAWHDQETRGDDTSGGHDHGSNENYAEWWRVGALDNRIADCNTFGASKNAVR